MNAHILPATFGTSSRAADRQGPTALPVIRPRTAMRQCLICFLFGVLAVPCMMRGQTPHFEGLGDLAGGEIFSVALDVSADGQVVVGSSSSQASVDNPPLPGDRSGEAHRGWEAFRWTAADGMLGLGDIPGDPYFDSFATAVSADGRIVTGGSMSPDSLDGMFPGYEGYRWSPRGGMAPLGVIQNGLQHHSPASGMSPDGRMIVGQVCTVGGHYEGYRWTRNRGIEALGSLYSVLDFGIARSATADRKMIIGSDSFMTPYGDGGAGCVVPVLYEGIDDLRVLSQFCGAAFAVTPDGELIVGSTHEGTKQRAVLWRRERPELLPSPFAPEEGGAVAVDVSYDGSVMVGYATFEGPDVALAWTSSGHVYTMDALAQGLGLGADGWTLTRANAVSGDGTTIVGVGVNPDGEAEAWRMVVGDALRLDGTRNGVENKP